jgi:hypothetical protein
MSAEVLGAQAARGSGALHADYAVSEAIVLPCGVTSLVDSLRRQIDLLARTLSGASAVADQALVASHTIDPAS